MLNIKRIKEICEYLDAEVYGKGCNYINDENDYDIEFYSRDYCCNISFEKLIRWYLQRINCYDEDDYNTLEEAQKASDYRYDLFIELINIYANYRVLKRLSK